MSLRQLRHSGCGLIIGQAYGRDFMGDGDIKKSPAYNAGPGVFLV